MTLYAIKRIGSHWAIVKPGGKVIALFADRIEAIWYAEDMARKHAEKDTEHALH